MKKCEWTKQKSTYKPDNILKQTCSDKDRQHSDHKKQLRTQLNYFKASPDMNKSQFSRRRSVGRRISLLARQSHKFLAKRLEPFDIGAGQFPLLAELYHEDGISQDELSERVRIDKANVTRGTARLEQAGYVIRKKDEKDRRVNRIFLTDLAREVHDDFFVAMNNWNACLLKDFTKGEQDMLLDMLQRMADNASS